MHETESTPLRELNAVGIALSRVRDPAELLPFILDAAIRLSSADGGSLYRVEGDQLEFECFISGSMNLRCRRGDGSAIPFPSIPLRDQDGNPDTGLISTRCANERLPIHIRDLAGPDGDLFPRSREMSGRANYRTVSIFAAPLLDHEDRLIGVLQLVNASDLSNGGIGPFSEASREAVESLASQAAVAWTNHRLISDYRGLFEDFIGLLADAIDAKSPYTGAHCRRVPELVMQFARALNETAPDRGEAPPFSEAELYELHVAALLHDCGKVATPVHVMDKSTKLETLTDRIELVRARFALWRFLERENPERVQEIDLHRQFVERCNSGREIMNPEAVDRLDVLSKIQVPGAEPDTWVPLITEDELANLKIERGTLNATERAIIEAHVEHTADMLAHLRFPSMLGQVPEIASNHHERMDGRGYPRGLKGGAMSQRARMLAIADVFEALTAPDRPYRKPISMEQAVQILQKMTAEGHFDPQLVEQFVVADVPGRYARSVLNGP